MFFGATSFKGVLSTWNTGQVVDMTGVFYCASSFNGVLSKWDTSKVTSMYQMFYNAVLFNQVLCWNCSNVIDNTNIFAGSGGSLSSYPSCLQW